MVNKRSKGRLIENKAKKKLEAEGWRVIQVSGSNKFKKEVDFFGLFDLIALLKGMPSVMQGTKIVRWHTKPKKRFIQVKTNRLPTKKEYLKLIEFKGFYCAERETVEWWTYWNVGKRKSKVGWEVIII